MKKFPIFLLVILTILISKFSSAQSSEKEGKEQIRILTETINSATVGIFVEISKGEQYINMTMSSLEKQASESRENRNSVIKQEYIDSLVYKNNASYADVNTNKKLIEISLKLLIDENEELLDRYNLTTNTWEAIHARYKNDPSIRDAALIYEKIKKDNWKYVKSLENDIFWAKQKLIPKAKDNKLFN